MSSPLNLKDVTLFDKTDNDAEQEARRVMTICNACRYCEGYCPVFPAMAARREFDAATLDYLANLCHNCTACYHACQYKPPHPIDINVPVALSDLRQESYARTAWPRWLSALFRHNTRFVGLTMALTVALVCISTSLLSSPGTLSSAHQGAGAFYAVISHTTIISVAGTLFLFGLFAMALSAMQFWRRGGLGWSNLLRVDNWRNALRSAATLEHLGGGHGEGCNTADESFSRQRRIYHQFTMWGFLLCFAATCVATVYEYALGIISPFPFFSPPVMLGTTGGIGLIIGPLGLLWLKRRNDPTAIPPRTLSMDYAFLVQLLLISATGLLLLALRNTASMPWLFTVHLGLVLAFFVTLPYSKFVHGIYRLLALLRYADEQRP